MTKRILVVDDDLPIREMIREILAPGPFVVEEAADGPSAVRFAFAHPPDLMVLDWMLPGLSGYQVWEILRREESTRQVPILVVTAFAGALVNIPPHQILHAILKPFTVDLFYDEVLRLSGA